MNNPVFIHPHINEILDLDEYDNDDDRADQMVEQVSDFTGVPSFA